MKIAFPPESKAKAVELMNGIRNALKQDIGEVDWMAAGDQEAGDRKAGRHDSEDRLSGHSGATTLR